MSLPQCELECLAPTHPIADDLARSRSGCSACFGGSLVALFHLPAESSAQGKRPARGAPAKKPNFLVIMTDDQTVADLAVDEPHQARCWRARA